MKKKIGLSLGVPVNSRSGFEVSRAKPQPMSDQRAKPDGARAMKLVVSVIRIP